jgi:hypothetical protein
VTGNEGFEAGAQPAGSASLTALFGALESFNGQEDAGLRFGAAVVDGLIKGNHKRDLIAQGLTAGEAVEHIKAAEGERSQAEEDVAWDHASLGEVHGGTLRAFGLGIAQDLMQEAHVVVRDGEQAVAALASIHEDDVTPEIQRGLTAMIREFAGPLPWVVIENHEEEVRALDAWPYWMKSGAQPEPDKHAVTVQTLGHGERLAAQCERLGVAEEQVAHLRQLSRYYQENMMVEWALAREMGIYDHPYGFDAASSLYRQRHQPSWDGFWRMLDFAEAKSMPGDTFVGDVRDQLTGQLTIFLRAMLAGRLTLDQEVDAATWLDHMAVEMQAAEEAPTDRDIAQILEYRLRLQAYGRK